MTTERKVPRHYPVQMDMFDEEPMVTIDDYIAGDQLLVDSLIMEAPECPIATEVMLSVKKRADEGMKTYGKTMERTDISTVGWIDHTIEELLDAANYLTRLKKNL